MLDAAAERVVAIEVKSTVQKDHNRLFAIDGVVAGW